MNAEQLIAMVARQTGVRLSSADPVLAVVAINDVMLDQTLAKLDRQVKVQADRVTAASNQTVIDAEKKAEALLTEAGEWAEGRIKAAGEAAAGLVLAKLRQETQKMEAIKHAMTAAVWTMAIIGLVTLSGVAGMVLAALR